MEIVETKLRDEFKIPITTSEPIVVYKETIEKGVEGVEGKSPNRHSKFEVTVMPLEKGVISLAERVAYLQIFYAHYSGYVARLHLVYLHPVGSHVEAHLLYLFCAGPS